MSTLRVATVDERPDLLEAIAEVNNVSWPEFMYHDPVAGEHFDELYTRFPEYQFVLVDDEDHVCVTGDCIPLRWERPLEELPERGWDFALEQGVHDHEQGREPTIVSAIQVVVRPDLAGSGLSRAGLQAMRDIAMRHGFRDLVAPVRPNAKHRYPLAPIERYIGWTTDDGRMFDPWLRVHQRAGATVLAVCPESMTIPAPVGKWEQWTGLRFPESGDYIVPGALTPVTMDVENDVGVYVEPNVWMHHRLA